MPAGSPVMLTHDAIIQAIPNALHSVNLPNCGPLFQGKVRDVYSVGDQRLLITTDRVSAFDRVLGVIPFKGQVLNELSAWWFEQTRSIVANHLIAVPDPNVTVARNAAPLPVEVIVRGYLTGVTNTSIWTLYNRGEREPYGIRLPDGMSKNDPLPTPLITPTTKAEAGAHDEQLTRQQILDRGLVASALWEQVEAAALAVFAAGQTAAQQAGLILVDTKYEFGLIDGQLVLIDEVHTPDSSRFWSAESYRTDRQPENYDKERLRLWYAEHGYRGDGEPPAMPDELIADVAAHYIAVYEKLTGKAFVPGATPAQERIAAHVQGYCRD